jgi:hypothetical protein
MTSKRTLTPDDVCGKPAPPTPEFTDSDFLKKWPQAAGELRGFASVLPNITGSQIRMAVQFAQRTWEQLTVGKKRCGKCEGNGSINNPDYMERVKNRDFKPGEEIHPWVDCPVCKGECWLDDNHTNPT